MATSTGRRRPTAAEIQETIAGIEAHARGDFLWTCAQLLKIKPEDRPLAPLELIDTQHYLHEKYAKPAWDESRPLALVILKSRRARVSTFWEAWFYHKVRWFPGQAVLIAAHLDESVNELYDMVKRFHDHLPESLQPKLKALNRKELAYEGLDSSISVASARYLDISRGQLINHCHIAEAPYLPDPETIVAGLDDAIPRRPNSRSSWVMEGTANGMGTWFHDFWKAVGRSRGQPFLGGRRWERCFISCFAHPDYWLPVPKDFEMTGEEIEMQREYQITTPQVVWYRSMVEEKERLHPGRGRLMLQQEHPRNADEAFLASGSVIFPPDVIDPLRKQIRPPELGFRFERAGQWQWRLQPVRVSDGTFLVWEAPQAQYEYAIGVDVSSGTGQHESTIVVVRMPDFVQVAEWGDNHTPPGDLAGLIAAVSRYYAGMSSRPIVNIDITGGWGISTNNQLSEMYGGEPFQLYIWESFDRLSPAKVGPGSRTGWLFTWVSKNVLISTALNLMHEGMVTIPSQTIQEDLRQLDEARLGQRITIQMSGNDRAVAFLLAIVAAWRKIARWSWPMAGGVEKPEAPVWEDPSCYDTTVQELLKDRSVHEGSTAGDLDVDWRRQW